MSGQGAVFGRAAGAEIIRAGPQDAVKLAALHARLFATAPEAARAGNSSAGWDARACAELLAQPFALCFVAVAGADREAVGLIVGQLAADEAEILSLGVAGEHRRRGIASRLLAAMRSAAGQAGARSVHLEVAAGNGPALCLYRGLGFAEAGRRTAYYARAGADPEDALRMRLALGAA
jgi:ribosomal-protein-alanine N-acetyltransferase